MTSYTITPEITKTKKVVVNDCYGGFNISDKAAELVIKYKTEEGIVNLVKPIKYLFRDYSKRDDPVLVKVVEELGAEANGRCSKLKIETVRDQEGWYFDITEDDGIEYIQEYCKSPDNKWRFIVEPE